MLDVSLILAELGGLSHRSSLSDGFHRQVPEKLQARQGLIALDLNLRKLNQLPSFRNTWRPWRSLAVR
jgi:hypothetical protein